jgi:hypothetical protein
MHLVCDLVSALITLAFHDKQVSMAIGFFFFLLRKSLDLCDITKQEFITLDYD